MQKSRKVSLIMVDDSHGVSYFVITLGKVLSFFFSSSFRLLCRLLNTMERNLPTKEKANKLKLNKDELFGPTSKSNSNDETSYNFPWLSNFNYNSVPLQLLSLYIFFSQTEHTESGFLPPNRSSLLASSRSYLFSYAMFCVNSLFYLFLSFYIFDFFWMMRKQREMGGTYRFFFLGFGHFVL